jgi:ribosomal protein L11 methyltransferase
MLDLVQAALLDYNVAAVEETTDDSWTLFFNTQADCEQAAKGLARRFPTLGVTPREVPDEDWAARSQANLRSIRIGNIIVAPTWDVPAAHLKAAASHADVVVIQPSMGFGTGHHATTRLCLAALQECELGGRKVIDVGTGSGVLAIAASMLGAADVLGIDSDPDAIQAANENIPLNPHVLVSFRVTDLRTDALQPRDVVIANLTGALLVQAARQLHEVTGPGGHLILSGFTKAEEAGVQGAYSDLATVARAEEDEWVCFTLHRT